jgi:hypothetical protein
MFFIVRWVRYPDGWLPLMQKDEKSSVGSLD